jgi:ATP-dependent DNA helicase RecQ
MSDYCHTPNCLRGFILDYFGETEIKAQCGNCGNCSDYIVRDITIEAQKIFSCIYRMRQQYGSSMVASVLKGSQQKRIYQLGFHELSTYGIMSDMKAEDIIELINLLAAEDYLTITVGKYPIVQLSPKAVPVLRGQQRVIARFPQPPESFSKESGIFQALRSLRQTIAKQQNIPPYVVFSDSTLREMCAQLPLDREAMLGITGVGEVKFERYGPQFIEVIRRYVENPESIESPGSVQKGPLKRGSAKKKKAENKDAEKKIPNHILTWQQFHEGMLLEENCGYQPYKAICCEPLMRAMKSIGISL